ncbi:MAG: anti-anti-sigma factor [Sandaracinus sp.]|nr:anti-anti-sigma factor [Sandaracinus sp.]|tara:strand:- start:1225 stop:2055 length:831 start_codon:yes stop_codon:yes gene_type:complete
MPERSWKALIEDNDQQLAERWVETQPDAQRGLSQAQIEEDSLALVRAIRTGIQSGAGVDEESLVDRIEDLVLSRSDRGYTPAETATYILSFKEPLFEILKEQIGDDSDALLQELWTASNFIDRLGLRAMEVHQRRQEAIIERQREEMEELSTPVVSIWDGIVALPVIGTLDSVRTQVVMEVLLEEIVQREADVAILDITGVPMVDTATAQHLLRTIKAIGLMGAECIISGVRPQIAQTMVTLGVDLGTVETRSTMAAALRYAFRKRGYVLKSVNGA